MLPIIPKEEFIERRRHIQKTMQDHGYDLLIAYSNDQFVFGQAHTRYFYNYEPQFEAACLFIPAKGDIVMITGPESEFFVKAFTDIDKVYVTTDFLVPEEEYRFAEIYEIKTVLKKMQEEQDVSFDKVGFLGVDSDLPYSMYKNISDALGVELEDALHIIIPLREVKTEAELEVIRYAYKIAEEGMKAALKAVKIGATEREIAAEAEYVMRKMGVEGLGVPFMVASGPDHSRQVIARTTHRKIQDGDLVWITIAPRYEGYHAAIARAFVVGDISKNPEAADAIKHAQKALAATETKLIDGGSAVLADNTARKIMTDADLEEGFVYSAIHSVGVMEFEQPIVSSYSDFEFKANSVYSIDIPVFLRDWGGFRIENGYIIHKDRLEKMFDLPTDVSEYLNP